MSIVKTRDFQKQNTCNIFTKNGCKLIDEWDVEVEDNFNYNDIITNKTKKELLNVLPTEFVEFAINIRDIKSQGFKSFSFEGREYLKPIYNTTSKRTLLKMARQTEKSTLLGNKLLCYSCMQVGFNSLYVSPTQLQTRTFSQDRIREPIEISPYLKSWATTNLMDNISLKKFINRSQITLRYAFLSADRCRGIASVDCLTIDEIQDILFDNIPVIEQTTSHGDPNYKIFVYAGTPKSLDNPIELYWSKFSSQNEWAIPCDKHTYFDVKTGRSSKVHWNLLLDDRNIGLKGLVCERCRNSISAQHQDAKWVSLNPGIYKEPNPYEGYHVSQLMVQWIPWNDILSYYNKYPKAQFFNEVLGISYDSGTKPLMRSDLINNQSNLTLDGKFLEQLRAAFGEAQPVYAGIDWSGGSDSSYTVLCLAAYLKAEDGNTYFTPFYWKRFEGRESDPSIQIELIKEILHKWRVRRVGCDYGGGFWPNERLLVEFGIDRIFKYQYANPKQKVKWDQGLKRFIVHRSEIMSDVINAIKSTKVFRFPNWNEFEDPFGNDFLAITQEYNEVRRCLQYQKSLNGTDDSFHSLVTCFLVSIIDHPRHDILNFNDRTETYD